MKITTTTALFLGLAASVHAQSERPGTKIWEFETGGIVMSTPAVVRGRVFFGSMDHKVYCVDAATGKKVWEFQTNDQVRSSAVVSAGRVYISSYDRRIYCLNADDGARIWQFETRGGVYCTPAVTGNRLFVGSGGMDHTFYCLAADTGEKLWSFDTGGDIPSSPCLAGRSVFFPNEEGKFYCLDATSGKKRWEIDLDRSGTTQPCVVSGGRAYVQASFGMIYCVESRTGRRLWKIKVDSLAGGGIALNSGRLYVRKMSEFGCFDTTDGSELWNFQSRGKGGRSSNPAVVAGMVFVGGQDSRLYCLSAESGKELWHFGIEKGELGSPAVVGGKVYVGSNNNKVYCIDTGDPNADGWPMFAGRQPAWPMSPGAKWTYAGGRRSLTLTFEGFADTDSTSCAVFKWSDGVIEHLSKGFDALHILRRHPAAEPPKDIAGKVTHWVRDLGSESFDERQAASTNLAKHWYVARSLIKKVLENSRDKEVQARGPKIRRLAADRFAPVKIPLPIRVGLKWKNAYGEESEVLGRENLDQGAAWKIRINDRLIWWSESRGIPLALQDAKGRLELVVSSEEY